MKTQKDLEKLIPDFETFRNFINEKSRIRIIDEGRLAEYYCSLLFDLELSPKRNDIYDATDNVTKERVEIKQRNYKGEVPPGMRVNLAKFDYLLYVSLGKDLLPEKILRFEKADIDVNPKNKRASFDRAVNSGNYKKIYLRNGVTVT